VDLVKEGKRQYEGNRNYAPGGRGRGGYKRGRGQQ